MDVQERVLSAGRSVLELLERDWQPLSAAELDLRLDQAMEDVLEADLLGPLDPQPPAASVPLQRSPAETGFPGPRSFQELRSNQLTDAVVKHVSDLLQSSTSTSRVAGRARLSLSTTVLLSLTLLSQRLSYRSASRRFQLEKGNVHRIFFSFCERLSALVDSQIRWPVGREAEDALFPLCGLSGSEQQDGGGVPRVLGVLGHTRIPVRIPVRLPPNRRDVEGSEAEVKRWKKEPHPDSWLLLELVCSRSGRFLHCSISRGPDVDRRRELRDKLLQNLQLLPAGCCLVAPAGFPLTAQVLTPYRTSHGPRDQLFNRTLDQHFQILDRAVASLKTRFQRLRYLDVGNYDRARAVVLTACVLQNVFLKVGQTGGGQTGGGQAGGGQTGGGQTGGGQTGGGQAGGGQAGGGQAGGGQAGGGQTGGGQTGGGQAGGGQAGGGQTGGGQTGGGQAGGGQTGGGQAGGGQTGGGQTGGGQTGGGQAGGGQAGGGQTETEDVLTEEVDGDDEAARRRDAVADFLFANVVSGRN